MFFQHIYDKTLAQASYLVGCQATGESIVIDAKRDIDDYLKIAKENNLNITHIAETHIHADFLSGSRELAAVTGAVMYLSDEGGPDWQYEFPHKGLKHKDIIKVGNLTLEVLHTPGHTPESISFLLTDHPRSDEPVMIFTGDFVFVGDIGRPDLLEKAAGIQDTKELGAKQMYESIQRFAELKDFIQVWPGHGAGSACGKSLGAVPSSTVGYEKQANWAFQYENDKEGFINYLLTDQPEPPKYFAMMKHLNKVDRSLLTEVPNHPTFSFEEVQQALNEGVKVIDTRDKNAFTKGHLPGVINIPANKSFATWMGWFLNYEEPFIVMSDLKQKDELTRMLMRIGLDNIRGFIINNTAYDEAEALTSIKNIDQNTVKKKMQSGKVQVVDVRGTSEYQSGHIKDANHVFLGTLLENIDKISTDKEVIVHCQSGMRSAIACSLLKRAGINNILNYSGGMADWKANGNEVVTA